ncbi:uncharacterized protein [Choristoneura fumiferana]|uniref:uncharacterized protein n=1 Tax=Choristoneura fumiferana TaxID=7141 RepID=UPI003D15CCE8
MSDDQQPSALMMQLIILISSTCFAFICICCHYVCKKIRPYVLSLREASNSVELQTAASSHHDSVLHVPVLDPPPIYSDPEPPSYAEAMKTSLKVRHRNSKDIINIESVTSEKRVEAGCSQDVDGETTTG